MCVVTSKGLYALLLCLVIFNCSLAPHGLLSLEAAPTLEVYPDSADDDQKQRAALLDLYHTTGGTQWTVNYAMNLTSGLSATWGTAGVSYCRHALDLMEV